MTAGGGPLRDLRGYGSDPPAQPWPTGAGLAVSIVVNLEEGAERTPADGDALRETSCEVPYPAARDERELIQESTFEYGSRVGHWRLLRLFDEFGVKTTVFACGRAVERNPELFAAYVDRGDDIAGHGYRWIPHHGLTPEEEVDNIRRCKLVLEEASGRPVLGWYVRPLPTLRSRALLAAQGIAYDCTAVNDDLPYFDDVDGRPFLVVPYALDANDVRFWKGAVHTAGGFFEYLRDAFDCLLAESAQRPRMLSIGVHGRISGRPGRIQALRRFLAHIDGRPGVWVAGRDDIARHWRRVHPQAEAWNW